MGAMKRFVEGECRDQSVLFPERLDDWIAEDNPVRGVDAFVDELDSIALGFESAELRPDWGRRGLLLPFQIASPLRRVIIEGLAQGRVRDPVFLGEVLELL